MKDYTVYKRKDLTEEELQQLPGRSNINNRATYEYWNRKHGITIDKIVANTNITIEDYLDPSLWTNILDAYNSDINYYRYSKGILIPRDSYSAGLEVRLVKSPVVIGFYRMLPIQIILNGIVSENHKFNREYIIHSKKISRNHYCLYYTPYSYKRAYSAGQECYFINGVIDSNYLLHQVKEFSTRHLFCSQRIQNILMSLEVQGLIKWKEIGGEIRVDNKLIAICLPLRTALRRNGIKNEDNHSDWSVFYVVESLLIQQRVALYKGEIYNAPYCLIDTSWNEGHKRFSHLLSSVGFFLHSIFGRNRIAERALQEREAAALQALEAKTAALEITKKSEETRRKLLLRLGHELKNPLHGTINLLHLAKEHIDNTESKHYVTLASNTVERLTRLVNTILESSNEERDIQLNNPVSFDILPVAKSVIDHFSLMNTENKNEYFFKSSQKEAWVYGESDKVSQILFNLLSNAAKHTMNGTITVEVKVNEKIEVAVHDTGIGIEQDKLNRVFDPYYQIGNCEDGLGIGLSVVNMLVQAHQGHVWITSELKKGTSVFFALQKGQSAHATKTKRIVDDEKIDSVWYVEDEVTNRIVLQKTLEKFCIDVRGFSNGQECLNFIGKTHPDILIVDLMMPNMEGFTLIEKVRQVWDSKLLPICVLSARDSQKDIQQAMETGADEYLGKPILPFDLEIGLRRLLRDKNNGAYGALIEQRAKGIGLSERETECALLVTQGYSNLEAAELLNISEATVKRHLYNIYNKVGCSRRTELIRFFTA